MILSKVKYYFKRSYLNVKGAPLLNLISMLTISFTMTIFTIFLFMFYNVNSLISGDTGKVEITAYLTEGLQNNQIDGLKGKISAFESVDNVFYTSKEKALKTFLSWNRDSGSVIEKMKTNPFPASFEISLKSDFSNLKSVKNVVKDIAKIRGIKEVDYSQEFFEKIASFVKVLKWVGMFLLGFLFLATIFLITNAIRLNVYSKRAEIGIMQIVGATDSFIKIPYLIEGIVHGLVGSLIACGFLYVLYLLSLSSFKSSLGFLLGKAEIEFIPFHYTAFLILMGMTIGFLGSNFALRKFLRYEK